MHFNRPMSDLVQQTACEGYFTLFTNIIIGTILKILVFHNVKIEFQSYSQTSKLIRVCNMFSLMIIQTLNYLSTVFTAAARALSSVSCAILLLHQLFCALTLLERIKE